jgi:cell division protein FtsB
MKTYEQLEKLLQFYRVVGVGLIILAAVAWTSSAKTNAQARVLLNENKKLQATNSDLGHNLSQARYELQSAQQDCTVQIEEMMYKLDGLKG